jgi:hypothetical protein
VIPIRIAIDLISFQSGTDINTGLNSGLILYWDLYTKVMSLLRGWLVNRNGTILGHETFPD